MALQVWLPLNGNLRNQGVSDFDTPLSCDTVTYTAGKTGANATFSNAMTNQTYCAGLDGVMEFTIAFWAKLTPESTFGQWRDVMAIGYNGETNHLFRLEVTNTAGSRLAWFGFGTDSSGSAHMANTLGVWNHFAVSVKGDKMYTYHNGKQLGTTTIATPGQVMNGNVRLSDSAMYCSIADLRIYDECLTYKQITELTKSLVIHYPLQTKLPITNIVKNQSFTVYNNLGIPYTLTKTGERFKGAEVWRLTMTPRESDLSSIQKELYGHGVCGFSQTWLANTKYSFWLYYKPITHTDVRVGGTASNINGWKEHVPVYESDGWYRVGQYRDGSVTEDKTDRIFTSFYCPSAAVNVPISIDFCAPYLIKDNTSIIAYDDYQIDSIAIENDVSGNSYDATINAVQPFYQTDTPRHSGSYNFTNNNQCLYKTNLTTSGFANTWTFTWWSKASSMAGRMAWGFADGNRLNLYPSTYFCMNTGDGANNPFKDTTGTAITFTKYEDNLWHFYAITGDGTANKLYIDGQLIGTSTTYKGITGTNLYISGWDTTTSYRWIGSLSDFRLYSTPLSAEDIKQMYYTGAYVDNDGYIGAYEFMEVD